MFHATLDVHLRDHRLRRALTQAQLASRAGISRQALGAIERREAVPSVEVALRLSTLLGVPVEEIFRLDSPAGTGAIPDLETPLAPGTRVRETSVAGRPVLVPADGRGVGGPELASGVMEVVHRGDASQEIPPAGSRIRRLLDPSRTGASAASPQVILAGCDPATTLLQHLLRRTSGIEMIWMPTGSRQALIALGRGQAHVAGFHLREDPGEDAGTPSGTSPDNLSESVPFPCTVVGFAVWEQGLLLHPGNPLGVTCVTDLARPDLRFLNRELGSGTRAMLDRTLRRARVEGTDIPGYEGTSAPGHWAVAQGVAAGAADAGVGIRVAARSFGLAWVPLEEERYDLVIPDHLLDDPGVAALLDLLVSPALRVQVESLGGYDVRPMGLPA